jgi:SM-20-related protein
MAVPHYIIDGFLPDADADALFSQMISAEADFAPSKVRGAGEGMRSSLVLPGRVGVDLDGFRAAVHAAFEPLCAQTGLAPFPVDHSECSIVAHRDGDYYRQHIDTRTGGGDDHPGHVRVLSCVYYLASAQACFSGGELALYDILGREEPVKIAPRHNRLVAFPSFLPHEVLTVSSPDSDFALSRFSINCWLHRAVSPKR